MRSILYKEIIPFFCRKMKEHEDTIDPDSPRDYLDYLILEARENNQIGYISIALTIWFLYVASRMCFMYQRGAAAKKRYPGRSPRNLQENDGIPWIHKPQ